jgi:putative hemolysin
MYTLIAFFLVSHIVSFICSIYEAVLLSCTSSYIALLKKKGVKTAHVLEELKSRIDQPLSAILTLNTTAHTIGAAGVGASVVEVFGDKWLALGSVILTFTMLYWTELLPKTIGALYWKTLAPLVARHIKFLVFLTYPVVLSFTFIARMFSKGKNADRITEEDIFFALEAGTSAGVIEEAEQDMVENIFRLGDRRVGVLMVPRVDIEWIDVNSSSEEIKQKVLTTKYRQFPLCDKDVDIVIGILQTRDLLERSLLGKKMDYRQMATPALFVNEHQHVFELMDLFKKSQNSVALVTDEYGTIQGMITLDDIFNAIVKDIEQGTNEDGAQLLKVNNRTYLLDGKLPIDEFKEIFLIETLPNEEKAAFRTLSGLCMTQIEAIPKKGDSFTIGNFRFEIVKVRKRRVEKVLLTRLDVPLTRGDLKT